ncbi:MAG TPA: four helix bundle protein [Vicinamibacterales bacterium]|nr:four helix bundle protein [Vicinamibacterales bacterium]
MKRRTKQFALDVLEFLAAQRWTEDSRTLRQQLIRAATSVGANYRAACRSRSRAEFIARIGVTLEEADEAAFWLELLIESRAVSGTPAVNLLGEADELTAIFAASAITAKANSGKG